MGVEFDLNGGVDDVVELLEDAAGLVEDEMGVGSVSCHWVDGGHGHAPDRLWNGQGARLVVSAHGVCTGLSVIPLTGWLTLKLEGYEK